MTRIAILTDIHGNLPALEAVIADAETQGCTGFVNLGDSLSGPLWPAETADLLIDLDWPTIAGNHERQLLTIDRARMGASDAFASDALGDHHLQWLASLPPTLHLSPNVLLCHGTPTDDLEHFLHTVDGGAAREATDVEIRERAGDRSEALILCGHTHLPRLVTLEDGRTIANPGSVGLQAYDDDHPVAYRVEVSDPSARYAIVDGTAVTFRAIDYDQKAAIRRAEMNGRDDWAIALKSGRMA
ncbi:metallophosphoesterase family protein [Sphingomonas asaccharolytica]|uniref:metallophosphoesterase family protein n=1 Tax=Sphingomonas asaccharolytica TaxID=40681 RepID=UPI00082E84D5|nr:metallophosphoesterase family protein [Sphingomonas asaccharolytica]